MYVSLDLDANRVAMDLDALNSQSAQCPFCKKTVEVISYSGAHGLHGAKFLEFHGVGFFLWRRRCPGSHKRIGDNHE